MEISYKQPGGTVDWTVLVDKNNLKTLETFRPRVTIAKQNAPLATNSNQVNSSFKQALGNVTTTFSMKIGANYGNNGAALAGLRVLTLALATSKNHLRVVETLGTAEIQYYPNAICTSIESDLKGQEVMYSIQFEADLVTTDEPS